MITYTLDENNNVVPNPTYKPTKNRIVAQEDVGKYWVSTVFLPIDHGYGGVPKFFETMVFTKNDGKVDFHDLLCNRYSTYDEAKTGHESVVNGLKSGELKLEDEAA